MATIGSQGFVDDGSGNLTVAGTVTAGALSTTYVVRGPVVLATTGSVSIPTPGFFQVAAGGAAGAGLFTGSLPAAASFPGSSVMIVETRNAFPYLLSAPMISMMSSSTGQAPNTKITTVGSKLTCLANTAVSLWSDSRGWVVSDMSGTITLSA